MAESEHSGHVQSLKLPRWRRVACAVIVQATGTLGPGHAADDDSMDHRTVSSERLLAAGCASPLTSMLVPFHGCNNETRGRDQVVQGGIAGREADLAWPCSYSYISTMLRCIPSLSHLIFQGANLPRLGSDAAGQVVVVHALESELDRLPVSCRSPSPLNNSRRVSTESRDLERRQVQVSIKSPMAPWPHGSDSCGQQAVCQSHAPGCGLRVRGCKAPSCLPGNTDAPICPIC